MNVLELFSGTGSVGKCCKELGLNVVSVDLESKFNPTHLCNIMDFDYKQYPVGYFDLLVLNILNFKIVGLVEKKKVFYSQKKYERKI